MKDAQAEESGSLLLSSVGRIPERERIIVLLELAAQEGVAHSSGDALDARLARLIADSLLSLEPTEVASLCSSTSTLARLIDVLKRNSEQEALVCLSGCVDVVGCTSHETAYLLGELLNLDHRSKHGWMIVQSVRRARLLTHELVIPLAIKTLPDASQYQQLKDCEALFLRSTGLAPSLSRALSLGDAPYQEIPNACSESQADKYLSLIHPWQRVLQSLALHAPSFYSAITRELSTGEVGSAMRSLAHLVPVYMVITNMCYPMGGGESFMHQTCRIMSELGYRCVWLSFRDRAGPHKVNSRCFTPFFEEVRIAEDMNLNEISKAIETYKPDLLHSQGQANGIVEIAAERHRIPALIGYHFWDGLVQLGGELGNRKIRRRSKMHRVAPRPLKTRPTHARLYVASEFMRDVYMESGGNECLDVFHPVPDPAHYKLQTKGTHKAVVQINIAAGKGGDIFLACAKALSTDIPFYAVQTEPLSGELDRKIKRHLEGRKGCEYHEYGDVTQHLAAARIVMVPTLVDETFCRVAYEAAANGIPVLSTENGFLPHLLGETGVYLPEDADEWTKRIKQLYWNTPLLTAIGELQRERILSQFGTYPSKLIVAAMDMAKQSPRRNIGFFAPWADQGLGEQTRVYSKAYRKMGFRTHVFSYQPYSARDRDLRTQHFPDDWRAGADVDTIYYSLNDRERVTLYELQQFVSTRSIGKLIYPEICYHVNWERITNLVMTNLDVIAVPNAETVRKSEIMYHNKLVKTWFNTSLSKRILESHGVCNGIYVGHGCGAAILDPAVSEKIERLHRREHIVFCHFGGHNARARKQTPLVIQAFKSVIRRRRDVVLRVYSMEKFDAELNGLELQHIQFVSGALPHEDVLKVYEEADVSVQVSSHEGLGLGFYESISMATPVVSLDIPPHNEVIKEGGTGWLLPADPLVLTDNSEAVVNGGKFASDDLADLVAGLTKDAIADVIRSTASVFNAKYTATRLAIKLAAG